MEKNEALKMDHLRPIYHYMPKKNWMNDPNGPIYSHGQYHLFYQYNPYGDQWGSLHWGHATSEDMVHWKEEPMALYPSIDKSEEHCYSGTTVLKEGKGWIIYTSIGRDRAPEQWLAKSEDMFLWEKYEKNPVVTKNIHGDLKVKEWRDPFVWQEGEKWRMVVGASIDGKGTVLFYESLDMFQWEYGGILFQDPNVKVIECPNFFLLEDQWVLIYSPFDAPQYVIGTFDEQGKEFQAKKKGTIDQGGYHGYYAPTTFENQDGQRIIFGWMPDACREKNKMISGWSGVQALPRRISINAQGELEVRPISSLKTLRKEGVDQEELIMTPGGIWESPIRGRALELKGIIERRKTGIFHIGLFQAEDRSEQTVLKIDMENQVMVLERQHSSILKHLETKELQTPYSFLEDGKISIHIFIDHSTIEVFLNHQFCISARIYTLYAKSDLVSLFWDGQEDLCIKQMQIWPLSMNTTKNK